MPALRNSQALPTSLNHPAGRAALALVVALLVGPGMVSAATSTWDGGGADSSWSNPTNWVDDVAPSVGDDLVFPLGAARTANNNDFPVGTAFNSLAILGANYTLNGQRIVLQAGLSVASSVANNNINLPITLSANQTFTVSNTSFSAALFLRGTIDLGTSTLTFAGPGYFQVLPVITGAGGLRKLGSGGALLYATNSYDGPLDILEGSVTVYRAPALGTTNAGTFVGTNASLPLGAGITGPYVVEEPLTLAGTLGSVSTAYRWVGPITLAASNATINVNAVSAPLVIDGPVSGGGLDKIGAGTLTLNATNTHTNRTRLASGVLLVNGFQPQSAVLFEGDTLGGTGVVGTVTATGALTKTLAPGGGQGILTCRNVVLDFHTTLAVHLNGPTPGSGYDQLNVNGSVALNQAALSVTLGYAPAIGDSFTIINNDGPDAVTGAFANLPEGTVLNLMGQPLRITYSGGTGNDVVLTRISPPTGFTSILRLTDGPIQLQATGGLPSFSYTILAATNLTPVIQWSNLGGAVANANGLISFTDTNAPLFPVRFYRALSP